MKTRNGFVSNSSSSSYIVEIHGLSYEDFVGVLLSEYRYFLEEHGLKKIQADTNKMLQDHLEEKGKTCEEMKQGPLSLEWHIDLCDMWIKDCEEDLETIKKLMEEDDCLKTVNFILLKNGIQVENIEYSRAEKGVRFSAFVSMHNDFGDMPSLLREIVLFFIFDTNYKVECERESDDDAGWIRPDTLTGNENEGELK